MNIKEYIIQNGKVKSKSGWEFVFRQFLKEKYCIDGFLITPDHHHLQCRWDEDGIPINLPTNHGLDLMPCIPVTSYVMVDKDRLKQYTTAEDFMYDQLCLLE